MRKHNRLSEQYQEAMRTEKRLSRVLHAQGTRFVSHGRKNVLRERIEKFQDRKTTEKRQSRVLHAQGLFHMVEKMFFGKE